MFFVISKHVERNWMETPPENAEATQRTPRVGGALPASCASAQLLEANATALTNPWRHYWYICNQMGNKFSYLIYDEIPN